MIFKVKDMLEAVDTLQNYDRDVVVMVPNIVFGDGYDAVYISVFQPVNRRVGEGESVVLSATPAFIDPIKNNMYRRSRRKASKTLLTCKGGRLSRSDWKEAKSKLSVELVQGLVDSLRGM